MYRTDRRAHSAIEKVLMLQWHAKSLKREGISTNWYTLFCTVTNLQHAEINCHPAWMKQSEERLGEPKAHVRFCVHLYRQHTAEGRRWLHERPLSSSSWAMPGVEDWLEDSRVLIVTAGQYTFGQLTPLRDGTGGFGHASKPLGFLSQS